MRWHVANWFGLAVALVAMLGALAAAVFIGAEPHAAMAKVSERLELDAAAARDYGRVLAALEARERALAEAEATVRAAQAETARRAEEAAAAQERLAALEQELAALRAGPVAAPQPAAGPRPCRTTGPRFNCILKFEPGSAGLDTVDRGRLEALAQSVAASGMRYGRLEIIGLADRPGDPLGAPEEVDCGAAPARINARLACDRAMAALFELRAKLSEAPGLRLEERVRARIVPTLGPSPSNRRADILVEPLGG